ncbi:S-4TM family putative pore-forming effector [Providencia stuartii]|uniref:S-4TM family putative pore-forming effector n=1 Tax=Providencia stuartii TaxID=588 RepID=UPI0034E43902
MSITTRQNLNMNIKLLAAQRRLYAKAKIVLGLHMILSVPIAILSAILVIIEPEFKGYVVIWGATVVLFDLFLFTPFVNKTRENAAKIQELFDTKVLDLPWNDNIADKKPELELICEESSKYKINPKRPLEDWYPLLIDGIPEAYGTIIAQRTNIWWDSHIRRKYAFVLVMFVIALLCLVLVYGIYQKQDVFQFFVFVLIPLVPTFVFCYRQITEHYKAAALLDKLKDKVNKIWSDAISSVNRKSNDKKIKRQCRQLQDLIFEHRKKNPPVFDFIFTMLRAGQEDVMNQTAEELVKLYNDAKNK